MSVIFQQARHGRTVSSTRLVCCTGTSNGSVLAGKTLTFFLIFIAAREFLPFPPTAESGMFCLTHSSNPPRLNMMQLSYSMYYPTLASAVDCGTLFFTLIEPHHDTRTVHSFRSKLLTMFGSAPWLPPKHPRAISRCCTLPRRLPSRANPANIFPHRCRPAVCSMYLSRGIRASRIRC